MLTDEQIRALRDECLEATFIVPRHFCHELCTRVLAAEAALDQAEIVGGLTANGNLWRFWSQKAMDYIAYCNKERDEARAEAKENFQKYVDANEALIEARRELEELDFLRYEGGEESVGREIEKAEAAGYRRGVEDAAKAVKDNQGVYKTKTAEAALEFAWIDVRALLEKVRPSRLGRSRSA